MLLLFFFACLWNTRFNTSLIYFQFSDSIFYIIDSQQLLVAFFLFILFIFFVPVNSFTRIKLCVDAPFYWNVFFFIIFWILSKTCNPIAVLQEYIIVQVVGTLLKTENLLFHIFLVSYLLISFPRSVNFVNRKIT